jgi:hypothetical protein
MTSPLAAVPGPIALFGSGETSPSGRKIFAEIFARITNEAISPHSPRVALLETPAGFELNSAQVAGKIADFISTHLQNYSPCLEVIPARKRGTPFSPDNPAILAPLLSADLIFMGPGSPTYTVCQLRNSLAWDYLITRHRMGAALALASAAVIALGAWALPVYEIYKVGEDLHWKPGLDLLGAFGLSMVFIPHWDNNDGGKDLDTSRCFMGQERFGLLEELLPSDFAIVGIDEQTGLILDLADRICLVVGRGGITLKQNGATSRIESGGVFSIHELGEYRLPQVNEGVPGETWQSILGIIMEKDKPTSIPPRVLALVEEREIARQQQEWQRADMLRERIAELGWLIQDTKQGPRIEEDQNPG